MKKHLCKSGMILCTFICLLFYISGTGKEANAANIKAEVISVNDSCSYAADAIGKKNVVIENYDEYQKLLGKIEKLLAKKCPDVPLMANDAYNAISGYSRKYFVKNNLCIFMYDVSDTGKSTYFDKFSKEIIDGKATAVFNVLRTSYIGGIEGESVSYYIVKVKKSTVKNVKDYICRESAYTAPVRSDSEYDAALQKAQPILAANDNNERVLYTNISAAANLNSNIAEKLFKKNVTIVTSYKQYKNLMKKAKRYEKNAGTDKFYNALKIYNKKYFKKNSLCIFAYYNPDTGMNTGAGKLIKEHAGGKTVIAFAASGLPYYGGKDEASYSYYFASIKKKDLQNVQKFECRRVILLEDGAVHYAGNKGLLTDGKVRCILTED
ncbi:MAG: hypothetical protein HFH14_10190 [Lachnospiraceae bacterium]|nr:hypothetical protein [Lachnospiraceae bacterium]